MKRLLFLIFSLVVFLNATAQNDSIGEYLIYYNSGEYYLLYESDTFWINHQNITVNFIDSISNPDREIFCEDYNLTFVRETSGGYVNYKLSSLSNFVAVCDSIYYDPRIERINFGYKVKLHSFFPDDEQVLNQWYLDKIDVFEAWDITLGEENITIGVIDEGLFLDHDDIGYDGTQMEDIYHNEGEDEWLDWEDPDSGNGDDDNIPPNGKVDDWKGWNYYNYEHDPNPHHEENNNVIPEHDFGAHGTAVGGVIAAKTNNALDIAGIAGGNYIEGLEGVKILPIKIMDYQWIYNKWELVAGSEEIPAALDYAVERGAKIISMSFGVTGSYHLITDIQAALLNAYNNDVLLVASAGNEGYDSFIAFPASDPNVIAVGGTDQDDDRAFFQNGGGSNAGDDMELTAPAVNIITLNNDTWDEWEGTSFSAPMVAATAALVYSINPELHNYDVRELLKNTAEKVGPYPYPGGWNSTHGYGRINTYDAVCAALATLPPVPTNEPIDEPVFTLHDIVVEPGTTLTITSTLYMGAEANFIIKPGAKVIIDGGTVTNYKFCGHEKIKNGRVSKCGVMPAPPRLQILALWAS